MKNRILIKSIKIYKKILHPLFYASIKNKKILFIFGSGRSGTTLLIDIFQRDLRTSVFGEGAIIAHRSGESRLMLKPFGYVHQVFNNTKSPIIISKPIVESQNALTILNEFTNSKAVWIYRNYKDVVASFVIKWGKNKTNNWNLLPIVEGNTKNWRGQNVSDETKKIILKYYSPDLNEYDSAALFWYTRNIIYFEKKLFQEKGIMLIKYEDFVSNPYEMTKKIYGFIGVQNFNKRILNIVHNQSVKKGKDIKLNDEINILCETLYHQLNNSYKNAN